MNYELAKKLKDAGFPDSKEWNEHTTLMHGNFFMTDGHGVPTLSKLIEACGEEFAHLIQGIYGEWVATSYKNRDTYAVEKTPEEAVAELWLALNKPK